MQEELYIYEERKLDFGRRVYKVKRKAKEVICWDYGYKWLIRKDRKSPQYCRVCANKGTKSYLYKRSPKNKGNSAFDRREYNRNYNNKMRMEKKKKIIDHMGNQCWKCGAKNLPICVWQWHHLNPEDKEIALSQLLNKSFEKILSESEKCVLVCSNCHKTIHYGEEKLENKEENNAF